MRNTSKIARKKEMKSLGKKSKNITKKTKKTSTKSKTSNRWLEIKKRATGRERRDETTNNMIKLMDRLPEIYEFYKTLDEKQIIALGFYKGAGSFFQTSYLINDRPVKFEYFNHAYSSLFDIKKKKVTEEHFKFNISKLPKLVEDQTNEIIDTLNDLLTIYKCNNVPKLKNNDILFRGMSLNNKSSFIRDIKIALETDEEYIFENFMSTSLDRDVATTFSHIQYNYDDNSSAYIFVFRNLEGIPFVYMPARTRIHYEKNVYMDNINNLYEFTLPRGLVVKIEAIEQVNSEFYNKNIKYNDLRGLNRKEIEEKLLTKMYMVYCKCIRVNMKTIKKFSLTGLRWKHNHNFYYNYLYDNYEEKCLDYGRIGISDYNLDMLKAVYNNRPKFAKNGEKNINNDLNVRTITAEKLLGMDV